MYAPGQSFWDFNVGTVVLTIGGVAAFLTYRIDRGNRIDAVQKAKDDLIETQARHHADNQHKMDALLQFQAQQTDINHKRDEQIMELHQQTGELRIQTAALAEIAKGIDRRVRMMEDR